MKYLFLFLKGMAVGAANVMPGVSGATIAVIFRIYDALINAVNDLFKDVKQSLKFLVPFGLAMAVGILAAGEIVDFFLSRFSMQTGGFIAGLMAGSLPLIHGLAVGKNGGASAEKKYYAYAAAAAIAIIAVTWLAPDSGAAEAIDEIVFSFPFALHLFAGGLFAAATMVIPGVSGAMVLMLFGLYPTIMHTITLIREFLTNPTNTELLWRIIIIAAPIGIGIIAGILLGSKVIAWLLKKYYTATYFVILGLVFGTIFAVFNDPATYQSHDYITASLVIFTALAFCGGAALSLALGHSPKK